MGFRIDTAKDLTFQQLQRAQQEVERLQLRCDFLNKANALEHLKYHRDIVIKCRLPEGQSLFLRGIGFNVIVNEQAYQANWAYGVCLQDTGVDTWEAHLVLTKTDAVFKTAINDAILEDGEPHPCYDFFHLMQNRSFIPRRSAYKTEKP